MLKVQFITDLGANVSVDISGPEKLLETQRHYGRLGWTSGDVPSGGYQFPLANEENFDWSLIGARKWTNPEGETLVIHKGMAYRRRELEAVDSRKMKLPAAVKYSRGARSTDPEHLREKADGGFEYITLAIFRGGKYQERYAIPGSQAVSQPTRQPGTPAAHPTTPPARAPGHPATHPAGSGAPH